VRGIDKTVNHFLQFGVIEQVKEEAGIGLFKEPPPSVAMGARSTDIAADVNTTKKGVDLKSHTGLRGISAIHIMLFHALFVHINIQGPSTLPLFFILSGFVLAVVYGRHPIKYLHLPDLFTAILIRHDRSSTSNTDSRRATFHPPPVILDNDSLPIPDDKCQKFECRSFYWNRFSRVLPTYYLCTLFAIPLVFAGYHADTCPSDFLPHLLISIIPVGPFFGNYLGTPLDGPAWFICTLLPFYFMFPYWLSHAQRRSDQQLIRRIVMWYWVQLGLIIGIKVILEPLTAR